MLSKEFCQSPGRTSACRAFVDNDGNGSSVVCDAFICSPLGKNTTLVEIPVFGNFSSARMKCDVAPESTIMVDTLVSFKFDQCAIFIDINKQLN